MHESMSAQFLLSYNRGNWNADTHWYVSLPCCMFRVSEYTLRDICHYLHAVISYEPPFDPLSSLDPRIDLTRPCYDQGQWFRLDRSIRSHLNTVHGTFSFYHKSFYDFLHDPTRSGSFCVNVPAIYCKFLDRLIQCHHHYAPSYAIDGLSTYFLPLHLPLTYLLFQTLCRHWAPLPHFLGHMEPSLLTPTSSWWLLSSSHSGCPVIT